MAAVVKAREEGRCLRRPHSLSSGRHPKSGLHPVQEGRRRLPVQYQEDPPEAHARPCTGASDIERLEYRVSVPEECVAYDRQGVHSPSVGEAL